MRRRDGEDGEPGFPGILTTTESRSDIFEPDSHFLFWKPGTVVEPEPDDMSWQLDPGTDLILNMHLRPSGKEETLQATGWASVLHLSQQDEKFLFGQSRKFLF